MSNMYNRNTIICGPFFGDLRTEITTFLPFVNFIKNNLEYENIIINSHINREFLYDGLTFFPIYEHLSINEFNQKHTINTDITFKEFTSIKKKFKKSIQSFCNTKDIYHFTLPYNSQAEKLISFYQKNFEQINFNPVSIAEQDFVAFIPDNYMGLKINTRVYEFLKENFDNVLVIGDGKTHFVEDNVVLKRKGWKRNALLYTLSYMQKAEMIFTPHSSMWTTLANLQNYPVISYGKTPGQYKENGVFNFGNIKSGHIYVDRETDLNKFIKTFDYTIDKVMGG